MSLSAPSRKYDDVFDHYREFRGHGFLGSVSPEFDEAPTRDKVKCAMVSATMRNKYEAYSDRIG